MDKLTQNESWKLQLFFDGECPLCAREVNWAKRRNTHGQVKFTDIAAPDFNAESYGLSQSELMDKIHARLPSGEILVGVEVFRQMYTLLGFPRLVALSRLAGVETALNWSYGKFAKNRLKWTGRCTRENCAVGK
ncbi:MAG: DUF393 domain-containing protein [Myxococcales bacterium]|nr:MAG: DUF393 domain-containing protein [Myxococcales bacterium]